MTNHMKATKNGIGAAVAATRELEQELIRRGLYWKEDAPPPRHATQARFDRWAQVSFLGWCGVTE